jgi:hypothetical protein
MNPFSFSWDAPEFEYREKDISWYWITIIVAALIIGFSVWERNFLFGLFIVIAEILVIVWGNKQPETVSFLLTEKSLEVGTRKFYPLKGFESWSLENIDDEWTELIFNFRAKLRMPLTIMTPTHTAEEIRAKLKLILKEVDYQPTFIDTIEKWLGF